MIEFTTGNLLGADTEAVVNTVNTVGVMGKGIALMFKEQFPENFERYAHACDAGEITVGKMFTVERSSLIGPKYIINFPTKKHWRYPSRIEWIDGGLKDLKSVILAKNISSIAIPPLGAGNGKLDWNEVRAKVVEILSELDDVRVVVYEPTSKYQNVRKKEGVEKLTPTRALVSEMIRRYGILGFECSFIEVQKLCWFLERSVQHFHLANPMKFKFQAGKYGPYSDPVQHLLNALDGSYLQSEKRVRDSDPLDPIHFKDERRDFVELYIRSGDAKPYGDAIDFATTVIDGFESPYGMELLATVDWLVSRQNVSTDANSLFEALGRWPYSKEAAERKQKIFSADALQIAAETLTEAGLIPNQG